MGCVFGTDTSSPNTAVQTVHAEQGQNGPADDGQPMEMQKTLTHPPSVTLGNNLAYNTSRRAARELEVSFCRAGRELLSAVSAEECSAIEQNMTTITVPRGTLLMEAWTEKVMAQPAADENADNAPQFPCIAWAAGTPATPPRLLNKRGLGRDVKIKPGTHAFVKMPGESSLRLSLLPFEQFGAAMGHPLMSGEQPVEAAGEVEIDAEGQLMRWNNLSGTYKVPKQLAFQASRCTIPPAQHSKALPCDR